MLSLLLSPLSGLTGGAAADVYEGQRDGEGRAHGKGTITHTDGSIYSGDWFRGEATGKGVINYPEELDCCGFYYDGDVLLMQPHGRGRGSYSCSAQGQTFSFSYDGEWERGLANGSGVMRSGDVVLYIGRFRGARVLL